MTKTAVAIAYGNPSDVVEIREAPTPVPGAGQAVVAIRASALNPIDVKTVRGRMGTDPAKLPLAVGFEAAGVVTAVGAEAVNSSGRPLTVGDEVVVYRATGGLSTDVLAEGADVHHKPAGLSFDVAAGLLLVGVTAADTIATAAVTAEDTLLVHGGAGAVGAIVVQLAIAKGAKVIATASSANHDFLRQLGAVPVAYGDGLIDRVRDAAAGGVTVAIDTVGTDEAADVSLDLVADLARIVTIAGFARAAQDGFVSIGGPDPESARIRDEARGELLDLAGQGKLVNVVAKTFPLSAAAEAHTELKTAHAIGKFILIP